MGKDQVAIFPKNLLISGFGDCCHIQSKQCPGLWHLTSKGTIEILNI